jgi:E3 ubiquitin-protein ligase makorin
MKKDIVDRYLGRLKTISCKHFEQSIKDSTPPNYKFKCQFGNHCHYLHTHPITKDPYIFSEEELERRRKPRRRAQLLDEIAVMEMLFGGLTAGYISVDEDAEEEELDNFEGHPVFEADFFGLCDDFDDFDDFGYDYGWD